MKRQLEWWPEIKRRKFEKVSIWQLFCQHSSCRTSSHIGQKQLDYRHRATAPAIAAERHGLENAARSAQTIWRSSTRRREETPSKSAAQVAVRVYVGARGTIHYSGLCAHGGTCRRSRRAEVQGSPAHATPCLRLRSGQQGTRYRALQAYLGHRNIQHTVRYTEPAPDRFKDFWRA